MKSIAIANIPKRDRAIYAGPTCGKTYFKDNSRKFGVRITDTDDLLDRFLPEWKEVKPWRTESKLASFASDTMGVAVGAISGSIISDATEAGVRSLILTNMVSGFTRSFRPDVPEWKFPVGFWRADPKELVAIFEERGSPITLDKAKKWEDDTRRRSDRYFEEFIWLGPGEYLAHRIASSASDSGISYSDRVL